jgi:tape measure domain-containing protein
MSKYLEYILSLKDQMSAGLQKVTGNANMLNQTLDKVQGKRILAPQDLAAQGAANSINRVSEAARSISINPQSSNALYDISRSAGSAGGDVNNLKNRVGELDTSFRNVSSGGITAFKIALGGLAAAAVMQVGSLGSSLVDSVIQGTIKREQDLVGLTTFLGENARKVYDAIQQDAATTPFNTESLLTVNRALISAGVDADKARKDTMNLANAISAVGMGNAELSRMAVNMQQIKNVGKATALDIKQFGFAGINIYQLLADSTGKSMKQLEEMDITYEQLSAAFEKAAGKGGLYQGALEKQGKTLGALIETARDQLKIFATNFGDSLRPVIEKWVGYFQQFVNKTPEIFKTIKPIIVAVSDLFLGLFKVIGKGVSVIGWLWDKLNEGNPIIWLATSLLGSLVVQIIAVQTWSMLAAAKTSLWAAKQWLLNTSMLANPITWIIAAVIGLIGGIAYLIYRYEGWGAAWEALVMYLKASWGEFKASFTLVWLMIEDAFLSGIDRLKVAWFSFQSLWDKDAAAAGLSKIGNEAQKRANEIAKAKGIVADFQKQEQESLSKVVLKDSGKSFKDMFSGAKEPIQFRPGIVYETLSGKKVMTKHGIDPGGDGKDKGTGGRKKSNETVATGGTKNTTIYLTIGKQIEKLTIENKTGLFQESAEQMQDMVTDALIRSLSMAESLAP